MKPLPSTFQRGRLSEQRAIDFLKSKGFEIISRNDRRYLCEVDALVKRDGCLFLVEIKSRRSIGATDVAKSLGMAQINRLRLAAQKLWLARRQFGCATVRGMLVVVAPDQMRVISLALLKDSC